MDRLLSATSVVICLWLMAPIAYVLSQGSFEYNLFLECLPFLGTSLLLSFMSATVSIALALPVALVSTTPSRIGVVLSMVSGLLLAVPDVVLGVALLMLYGKTGIFGILLGDVFVNSWLGLLVAQLYCLAPYCMVLVTQVFRNTNREVLEAAYALGASRSSVIFHIYLKGNIKSFFRILVTCTSFGLSMFGVIVIFAYFPKVMTTEIFERFQLFQFDDAMAFAGYLLMTSFVLYTAATFIERRKE